ncbi:unnamed protein product [Owenia fusiformis]|uniref:Uncharacterized protein n=1 Tax=Owenia fusiformis TaxID=6347 RepID=A0A8J1UEE9_OWEFU|nr:unnamed protein product [Owenia fusiformis]
MDANYWIFVVKFINRISLNQQMRDVSVEFSDASTETVTAVEVQYVDCSTSKWTSYPLPKARRSNFVKFTVLTTMPASSSSMYVGFREIQIFTGNNMLTASSPIVDDTFDVKKKPSLRTLTDMDTSVCSFDVAELAGRNLMLYTNAIGLQEFKLKITTNGGAAGDFDVYQTYDINAEVGNATTTKCNAPVSLSSAQFEWICECGGDCYAALVRVQPSDPSYQICEIELNAL